MARSFVAGDTSIIVYTAQGMTTFPYGSVFFAIRRNLAVGATNRIIALLAPEASAAASFLVSYTNTLERIQAVTNGANTSTGATATTINQWSIIGMTKATGSVAPVLHQFYWPTGVWLHETGGTAIVDSTGTGLTSYQIGGLSAGAGGGTAADLSAEVAAMMVHSKRVLSTGEIERLPSGSWDRYNPDMLIEFPSGRDDPAGVDRDVSRNRMRQTSGGSTTVRATVGDPPGFRYSRLRRRT